MASPVIMTELAFSVSTSRQTSWGSNLGTRMVRLPTKLWPMTDHWVAPCISGAMGSRVSWPPCALLHHLLGALHPGVGGGVDAAAQGVEDILVPPDHALGHAGGAAGVEDVVVVVRPRGEVPFGTAAGQGLLVGHRPDRQGLARAVVDGDHAAGARAARAAVR